MAKKENVELLLEKGIITAEQLTRARQEAARAGIPTEKALEKLGFISAKDIAMAVANFLGVPFMDLSDYLVDPEVIKLVPESTAKKYKAVPLFKIADSLTVAMVDPQDIMAIDEIRIKSNILRIEPVLSTTEMIQQAIDQYYNSMGTAEELIKDLAPEKIQVAGDSREALAGIAEEAPVIKLVNLIVVQAVKDKASDIHVEPEEEDVRIRYRIDGILHQIQNIPKHLQSAVSSRIKVMAKMDIAQTRQPQDGRIQLKMENRSLDIRVSSFPTTHGENIVMRLLDKSTALLGLKDLGLGEKNLKIFERLLKHPNGIILVTGPTGAGKTTTLYAALGTINSVEKNIITIEDPVEYQIPMVRQTQVNPLAGLSFANGLRSILRQDPDVIMVGEIRDKETAEISIQASLTGHLVFSTLHTNDAATALTRLIDMEIEPFLISSSVIGILAQRLVRLICPKCKESYTVTAEMVNDLSLPANTVLYRGRGCAYCKNTGFSGRIGIFEVLVMANETKHMVASKSTALQIRTKAIEEGMRTLYDDGMEKVKNGLTTIEELLRVTEEV
ncbi:MAG: GspE/PulE family protein [Candidatus Omnitrophica bacterium]|nr:GspE/PulE family protein [Candidatus Omnitrophota bacterium]